MLIARSKIEWEEVFNLDLWPVTAILIMAIPSMIVLSILWSDKDL